MEINLFSIFNFLTFQRGGNLTITITQSNQFFKRLILVIPGFAKLNKREKHDKVIIDTAIPNWNIPSSTKDNWMMIV